MSNPLLLLLCHSVFPEKLSIKKPPEGGSSFFLLVPAGSLNDCVDGLAQGFEGVLVRGVEQALLVEDDVAAGGFEFVFDEGDALAAPAVGLWQ